MEAPRTRITVSRTGATDIGQRQVIARIDDGSRMTLMFGESFTADVEPGEHLLRLHNTLVRKRVPFSITAGAHLEFQVINRPGRFTLGFLSLLGVAPLFLTVEQRRVA